MRKTVNFLLMGWVLGIYAINPASVAVSSMSMVEAAPALAFVSGTVKDEAGAPLVGAVVALLEARPRGKEIKSVKTDAQGHFSAGIAPGVYRLRAMAEGFFPSLQPINVDRPVRVIHDFALKRDGTLVQKRGDRDDYRWIGLSVPRQVLNVLEEDEVADSQSTPNTKVEIARNSFAPNHPTLHGMV